jgi:hypothetical protein
MASGPYYLDLEKALKAYYEVGDWYAMLLSAYDENRDTHEFLTSARGDEIPATGGYTTDGQAIATPSISVNLTTDVFTITFPQVVWSPATISATHCLYYRDEGSDAASTLGFVNNFEATVISTNAAFTVPASNFQLDFPPGT